MREAADNFRAAILAALGGSGPEHVVRGELQRFSTSGRANDKAGWCQLFDDGRAGVFGDFRSGLSSVWTAKRREQLTQAERTDLSRELARSRAQRKAQRKGEQAVNARRNEALWAATVPVLHGDPVSLYLSRRGLAGPVPACLRLHPALTYWDEGNRSTYPAMIAPLIHQDGSQLALHRTYLTADGQKAPVSTVKKLTGAAGALAGAYIPLHDVANGVIGIAEGIETAQAAHLASGLPTVAAYCAGNLAGFMWPADVSRLVIFADADPAGTDAAHSLKTRAVRAGLRVLIRTPSTSGLDWCDVWSQRDVAKVECPT
jgi:putative DNA primase/helicase